jgi:hypothetical protein
MPITAGQVGPERRFVAPSVIATEALVLLMLCALAWIVGAALAEEAVGSLGAVVVSLFAPVAITWLLWRTFRISATLTSDGVQIRNIFRRESFSWREIDRVQPAVITMGRMPVETIGIRSARTGRLLPVLAVAGSKRRRRALYDALRVHPELAHAEFEYWRD